MPNSPYNETQWPDQAYVALVNKAPSTMDATKRAAIVAQLQTIDFEQGSYIIPSYNQLVAAAVFRATDERPLSKR